MWVKTELLDQFLVVFESNFNRAVWACTRLKEVAEREKAGSGGRESVGYNFGEADSLRLIANHLVLNYLSSFIHRKEPTSPYSPVTCLSPEYTNSSCRSFPLSSLHLPPLSAYLPHFSRRRICPNASMNRSPLFYLD